MLLHRDRSTLLHRSRVELHASNRSNYAHTIVIDPLTQWKERKTSKRTTHLVHAQYSDLVRRAQIEPRFEFPALCHIQEPLSTICRTAHAPAMFKNPQNRVSTR